MKTYRLIQFSVLIGTSLLLALEAEARVGGGDSYGGGSRSSGGYRSGGSGGGDAGFLFDLIYILLRVCFRYPAVGIPLLIIAIFLVFFYNKKNHRHDDYYSSYGTDAYRPVVINRTRDYAEKIASYDPNFSFPIFKDFVFSLYHSYHENRGANKLENLSAFFDSKFLTMNSNLLNVDGVVIGNCTIAKASINSDSNEMTIEVGFSANYTEMDRKNVPTRYKISETWRFRKSTANPSPLPEKMSASMCPNCGAPITETISGVCQRCNQSNRGGRFVWFVYDMVSSKEILKETSSVENDITTSSLSDYGVNLPTLRDPDIQTLALRQLGDEYTHLQKRAEKIFFELQKAWTQKNWNLARPYETDTLFHTHLFWMEDFKRNGQTNFIGDIKINGIEPVSLIRDKFYASFTFRIFADMVDYTLDKDGRIIRGNRKRPIKFSEYWTFIKGINNNQKTAKTQEFHLCPSCGANLKIEMSGVCDYCGTKVTLGQFDWVLSQIEQDEEFAL